MEWEKHEKVPPFTFSLTDVIIKNSSFRNSPFWNLTPVLPLGVGTSVLRLNILETIVIRWPITDFYTSGAYLKSIHCQEINWSSWPSPFSILANIFVLFELSPLAPIQMCTIFRSFGTEWNSCVGGLDSEAYYIPSFWDFLSNNSQKCKFLPFSPVLTENLKTREFTQADSDVIRIATIQTTLHTSFILSYMSRSLCIIEWESGEITLSKPRYLLRRTKKERSLFPSATTPIWSLST